MCYTKKLDFILNLIIFLASISQISLCVDPHSDQFEQLKIKSIFIGNNRNLLNQEPFCGHNFFK
jgi:hypothetical protein